MSTTTEFLRSAEAVGVWTLVPTESSVGFRNKTMWGLASVTGHFTRFSGHGEITDGPTVTGELDIDAASVGTGLKMRDNLLRSNDFLYTRRFPRIVVVVTDARTAGGGAVDLQATITITGTTRPLPLRATVARLDGGAIRVAAEKTIDHDELGIRWNRFWMISRYTTISADLLFQRSNG